MGFRRAKGRFGVVHQEEIRPFVKRELLALTQRLKRVVISGVGSYFGGPQLALRPIQDPDSGSLGWSDDPRSPEP